MSKVNYWNKILDFFGFNEINDSQNSPETEKNNSKIVSLNRNKNRGENNYKLIFYYPDSYEEGKKIADDLKNSSPVILNLEKLDKKEARQFIDFLSGVVYALNGKIKKVGSEVFLFTPNNIKISGEILNKKLKNKIIGGQK